MHHKPATIFLFLLMASFNGYSQIETFPTPYFSYSDGLGVTSADSLFKLNIRFRMQNRLALTSASASDLDIAAVEARVRRLRLRLDGFIYTPRLSYVIQLSFTRADMDFDDTGFPNIIRDAMIIYRVSNHFSVGLGQTKLPGNRQRVNSSGDLQFADRSIVNSTFNIDRDFGVQAYYNNSIRALHYVLRGAISSAETLLPPTGDLPTQGGSNCFHWAALPMEGTILKGIWHASPNLKFPLVFLIPVTRMRFAPAASWEHSSMSRVTSPPA